jgi:hypothetical protein
MHAEGMKGMGTLGGNLAIMTNVDLQLQILYLVDVYHSEGYRFNNPCHVVPKDTAANKR